MGTVGSGEREAGGRVLIRTDVTQTSEPAKARPGDRNACHPSTLDAVAVAKRAQAGCILRNDARRTGHGTE